MKANILSRKDQMNTQDDKKDVQMLKEELWKRRTIAVIMMLRRNSMIEKTELLKKIQQNRTREQEVIQELKKEAGQTWEDNGIVYIPNNKKI